MRELRVVSAAAMGSLVYHELQKMMQENEQNNYQIMQLSKYLCVNKKNLAKEYFEMPAGYAEEDDEYKKHDEQHVELLNDDPPLYTP